MCRFFKNEARYLALACLATVMACSCTEAGELKLKANTDVSIKFFKGSQVFVYNYTEASLAIEFSMCAGVSEGLKVSGVGAEAGLNACFDWTVSVPVTKKARDREEVFKLLKEYLEKNDSKKGVADELRKKLSQATDAELREVGIKRSEIEKINEKSVSFGELKDSIGESKEIRVIIEECPDIPANARPKPVS